MKTSLLSLAAAAALVFGAFADGSSTVSVVVDDSTNTYNLAALADDGDVKGAKSYVDAYADNVCYDKDLKANEAAALATIRTDKESGVSFYGTWWAIFPPILAILLALVTKEVYSSLFVGIVAGGVLYSGFSFEGTLVHVAQKGFIGSVADPYNVGILLFLVLLGALVAMMNKTGASAAFGRWAQTHIKSRVGAQVATIVLGMLIFVDDYFNCLTVGSVMRPVTDAKKVSRAKLSYLLDATAAPICIIAPISSWAAAVAGFAKGAGAESGFSLFINAIPYNYYAILTILAMFFFALTKFDFGPMKRHEAAVSEGLPDLGAIEDMTEQLARNDRGRVIDLVVPVVVLIASCMVAIMILCCAWALKTMTDSLGAKIFISDLINGPAAGLWNFLPAIIFVIAIVLAFSTGTSWGTFGILIPIVLAAVPGSSMTIVAVSACMAGAVCGDHCSPISDTTIMASAGAQCNHIVHVGTQLPYALAVAAVSFVAYVLAPFIGNVWLSLGVAVALLFAALFAMKAVLRGRADLGPVMRALVSGASEKAFAKVMRTMGKEILANGKVDFEETGTLLSFFKGIDGEAAAEFRSALLKVREDGEISAEESAKLEEMIRKFVK